MFARRLVGRVTFVAAVMAVCVLGGLSAAGQEEPHPIVAQARAELKDPAKPFTLSVRISLMDGTAEKFEAAFAKSAKLAREEKGCLAYELNRDAKGTAKYLVYERWKDLPALEAHIKSEHFQALAGEVHEMLDGPPEIEVYVPAGQ